MTHPDDDIAIVGAGIIGLTAALKLLQRGYRVTLFDPEPPGMGTSYGNAGTLATYAVLPLAQPALLREVPKLLLVRDSPLRLCWSRLGALAPWLWRFVRQASHRHVAHNSEILVQLLGSAGRDWTPLLDAAGATSLKRDNGCLYAFVTERGRHAARDEYRQQQALGVDQQMLTADEVDALEPALQGRTRGGVLYPQASHIIDPLSLSRQLAVAIKRAGGRFERVEVRALRSDANGVTLDTSQGQARASRAIVAAGIYSAALADTLGDRVPLAAERGYHLEFPSASPRLTRPCCLLERGFYMTPLEGRLRVAGTVELGDPRDPPSEERYAYLHRSTSRMFDGLGEPTQRWMGSRPSVPDSIPVIGPSPRHARVQYAFGHGHLGLTMAATTARLLADELAGQAPAWLTHCRIDRFQR